MFTQFFALVFLMRFLLVVFALVCACSAEYLFQSPHINRVNSREDVLWQADLSERFLGWTHDELSNYFNAKVDNSGLVPMTKENMIGANDLPKNYDVRKATGCGRWILDQGRCGSCWAFGATKSVTDRFCQALNDTSFPILSPQHLVSCDYEGNMGCNGGFPGLAHKYIEFLGVSTLDCYPYTSGTTQKSGSCHTKCHDGSSMKRYHLHKFQTHFYRHEEDIMAALIKFGSAEVSFSVYDDFLSYSSGIYHHVSGPFRGGHAVTLIGYGEENGQKYWTCANSWGENWGEQGTFRILRGVNECGMESNGAVGGLPKL
ncbi:hypothetical protein GEMRC1_003682 [Eukaryota sp. GEM-RC1]